MTALLALGGAVVVVLAIRGFQLMRDPGVAQHLLVEEVSTTPVRTSLVGKLLDLMDRVVGRRAVRSASTGARESVRRALARAGQSETATYETVIARQATWAAIGGVMALILLVQGSVLGLPLPILGWFFPRISLVLAGRRRGAQIDKEMPDFLDVLAVTISAGLGFRAALQRVGTMVGGAVGEEMLVVLRQIDLGTSRRQAFAALRERSASRSMSEFVTAYMQAEELGAPVGEFLTSYATEMRRTAGQRARTAAAKANPKISLVLTLVIMPAISGMMVGAIAISTLMK